MKPATAGGARRSVSHRGFPRIEEKGTVGLRRSRFEEPFSNYLLRHNKLTCDVIGNLICFFFCRLNLGRQLLSPIATYLLSTHRKKKMLRGNRLRAVSSRLFATGSLLSSPVYISPCLVRPNRCGSSLARCNEVVTGKLDSRG